MKLKQEFIINYPLKHKVVEDLKIVTRHEGDLIVTGTAYCDPLVSVLDTFDRYSVDIDFIRWNGCDITPVLEVIGALDDIVEYCIKESAKLFDNQLAA